MALSRSPTMIEVLVSHHFQGLRVQIFHHHDLRSRTNRSRKGDLGLHCELTSRSTIRSARMATLTRQTGKQIPRNRTLFQPKPLGSFHSPRLLAPPASLQRMTLFRESIMQKPPCHWMLEIWISQ